MRCLCDRGIAKLLALLVAAGKCTGSILGLALPLATREDKHRGTVLNEYIPNNAH